MPTLLTTWLPLFRDDRRVRRRFERVERALRARDVSALPPASQQARSAMLDHLRTYYRRSIFPRNYEHRGHRPSFIDRDGRECAVAYLMIQSGQKDLALHISAEMNDAYVRQLTQPEVKDWAAQTGLTAAELALIQPSYQCTFDPATFPYMLYHVNGVLVGLVTLLYAAGGFSLIAGVLNVWAAFRKRHDMSLIAFGILAGLLLIVTSVLQYTTALAYSAPIHQYLNLFNGSTGINTGWRPCLPTTSTPGSPIFRQLADTVPQAPVSFYLALLMLGALLIGFCLYRWWRLPIVLKPRVASQDAASA